MPSDKYFAWMCLVVLVLCAGVGAWAYQIWVGIGAAGKRTPQMWAMYITTFVFWIGIGHAGTLISAVLYLFRAKWRTSIYRGRGGDDRVRGHDRGPLPPDPRRPHVVRVLAHAVPQPALPLAELQVAAGVGRVRDLDLPDHQRGLLHRGPGAGHRGPARQRDRLSRGRSTRCCRSGWEGSDHQWRHYRRGYGLLAALATPLVLSVHSVVSFDFAMALVPGWHSTLFPPVLRGRGHLLRLRDGAGAHPAHALPASTGTPTSPTSTWTRWPS